MSIRLCIGGVLWKMPIALKVLEIYGPEDLLLHHDHRGERERFGFLLFGFFWHLHFFSVIRICSLVAPHRFVNETSTV